MNKKILSAFLAVSALFSSSVFAYEEAGKIMVNNREFFHEEAKPVMINDRILVPYNKIFKYAGISANYYEDENKVIIDSSDNKTRLALTLDDNIMRMYKFKTVIQSDRTDIPIDVPAQNVNGTVMCPLRSVLEALDIEISWDDALQAASFNTIALPDKETLPKLSIKADKESVKKGESVTLSIVLSNIDKFKDLYTLDGITNCIVYDKDKFSYTDIEYIPENPGYVNINAANGEYSGYGMKSVCLTTGYPIDKGEILCSKITFTALTDDGGDFYLSDKFSSLRGGDNDVLISDSEKKTVSYSKADMLYIDTTPVTIK